MSLADRAKALELLDRAQTCFDAGRAQDALLQVRLALQHDPDSFAARMLEARLHVTQERPAAAMRSLDAISVAHPEAKHRPDVSLLRAEALAAGGESDLAIDHLLALARRFSDDVRPYRLLATIHLQKNDNVKAIAALRKVAQLEPNNAGARRMIASLTAATNPQRGADELNKLSPRVQDDAALLAAAHWFIRAGRDADARALLDELCERHGDDSAVLIATGELGDRIGDHAGAIKRLEALAAHRGAHQPRALLVLAKACMHAGRFSEAALAWFKLTRLSPRDARAWSALAVCAAMAERFNLMERALRRGRRAEEALLANQPTRFVAEAWLRTIPASIVRQLNNSPKETAPNDSPLTSLLRRSLETLKGTSQQHPSWADTHYHTAVCHAALGDSDAAKEQVQAALDINPHYRAAVTLAGRLSHSKLAA